MKVPFITKKTSLDSLRAAVVSGEADMIAAEKAVETTAAARAAALLDDDETIALTADDEARRAVLRRDRAVARLEAARQSLAEAEEAEATAKRAAHRKALDARNVALRERITTLLATAAADFRILIGDIEAQRAELQKFNSSLSVDEERVADPEAFRSVPSEPDEVVSERIDEEWCEPGAVRPLNAVELKQVTANPDGKTGWLRHYGGSVQIIRRCVRRRIVRERTSMTTFHPLASVLSIPGLLATDRPGWSPTEAEYVNTVLAALDLPHKPRQRTTREVVDILDN